MKHPGVRVPYEHPARITPAFIELFSALRSTRGLTWGESRLWRGDNRQHFRPCEQPKGRLEQASRHLGRSKSGPFRPRAPGSGSKSTQWVSDDSGGSDSTQEAGIRRPRWVGIDPCGWVNGYPGAPDWVRLDPGGSVWTQLCRIPSGKYTMNGVSGLRRPGGAISGSSLLEELRASWSCVRLDPTFVTFQGFPARPVIVC